MTGNSPSEKRLPLAIDLFCGLGGWLLAEGYQVIGFDIEQHVYGEHRYPAQLVLQDVRTLHGRQFKDAALIVASPPCQEYSYRAMPWKRAKALPPPSNELFDACFRIQREACKAAGRHIPLVVENVRGAQPWVGRSRWNFGSYHLWGDVPALMPVTVTRAVMKAGITHRSNGATNWHGQKNGGGSWFRVSHNNVPHSRGDQPPHTPHMTNPLEHGIKQGGDWFEAGCGSFSRYTGSKSPQRKAASAMIAKIPFPLARHIAAVWRPA